MTGQAQDDRDRTETMAEYFDRLFGPVLSGPWAERLVAAVGLHPGERVLDVACGSGAVAAVARERVAPDGAVTGLDPNPDMLAVARRKDPAVTWTEGRAEALPFGDGSFDAVLCQFGLMFFDDRAQALGEMGRVLQPGGRLGLAVWDRLEATPGYAALTELAERHLGVAAAAPIRASFALGDPDLVAAMLAEAGFRAAEVASVDARARFPSLEAWVDAELKGWADAGADERAYAELMADARRTLSAYVRPDGSTDFALPAVVGVARRP